MFKRVVLFLAVNILVMTTISLILSLLGVGSYLTAQGINYGSLAVFCLVWGMGGAFISLLLSKTMAKWGMGVKIIDPNTRDAQEMDLVGRVYRLARAAGLQKMPEVGYYESPEVNAFATGPSRNNSLVAVSTGLMQRMTREEVDGVLGHEIAHVANGDMVTMTLVQGVINAFSMFLARILAFAISNAMKRDDNESTSPFLQYALVFVFEIIFMILGSLVVAAFSRYREFRADAGGAKLSGKQNMINALRALQRTVELNNSVPDAAPAMQSMKISGRSKWLAAFSSHPPLEDRIARLQASH